MYEKDKDKAYDTYDTSGYIYTVVTIFSESKIKDTRHVSQERNLKSNQHKGTNVKDKNTGDLGREAVFAC